jgi:hypothetical protein
MSKRLVPYGQENYAGNLAAISEIIKSRRLHPHGSVAAIGINKSRRLHPHGNVAAVGTTKAPRLLPCGDEKFAGSVAAIGEVDKSPRADTPRDRRLVRLKAKAG